MQPLANLATDIGDLTVAEGFILSGIAPAVNSVGYHDLIRWIENGYAAQMNYFANRLDAYEHPSGVLPGAKSLIVLAYPYPAKSVESISPNFGRTARYTWIDADYHDIIHPKLKQICRVIRERLPGSNARGVVDTAPLMEREYAQLAGLGWRGKNTLLLNRSLGSYFFLACVLVDIDLPYDEPHTTSHCGTCTACLDACPTDAFPSAGVLDASRCISYLTIEHRAPIQIELREGIGDWVFGCDICQEVCPWNTKVSRNNSVQAETPPAIELTDLFFLTDEQFRARFRKTPMWRTRRSGLLRNAAIVLGNTGTVDALEALQIGLNDPNELVRESSAWAIERIRQRLGQREPNHSADS